MSRTGNAPTSCRNGTRLPGCDKDRSKSPIAAGKTVETDFRVMPIVNDVTVPKRRAR